MTDVLNIIFLLSKSYEFMSRVYGDYPSLHKLSSLTTLLKKVAHSLIHT